MSLALNVLTSSARHCYNALIFIYIYKKEREKKKKIKIILSVIYIYPKGYLFYILKKYVLHNLMLKLCIKINIGLNYKIFLTIFYGFEPCARVLF